MLTCIFWDVQHGSAAYVRTPNDSHFAIDLGTGSYGTSSGDFSPLLHLNRNYSVDRLDGVIITHPHRDHIDDILNFDALNPRILWRPNHLSRDDVFSANLPQDREIIEKYLQINNRFNHPVDPCIDPFVADNNGGVEFRVFTPKSSATSNINNHSLVTVISYEGCKLLIPGDNEPPSWNELLNDPQFVEAIKDTNVLVAPHHGRQSGFSTALFEHIAPELTVISDGRFSDTSATSRYAAKTSGWTVHRRSGGSEERKCVTTRSDGVIVVKIWRNPNGGAFMQVTIK